MSGAHSSEWSGAVVNDMRKTIGRGTLLLYFSQTTAVMPMLKNIKTNLAAEHARTRARMFIYSVVQL